MMNDDDEHDCAKQVVQAGALRATISAMKQHASDAAVQYDGFHVLQSLVAVDGHINTDDGNSNNHHWGATALVKSYGIELVVAVMKNHANDQDLLEEGCAVLAKLAELNVAHHRRKIILANGLQVLSQVIQDYQDEQHLEVFKKANNAVRLLVSP
jgi:hypothetical protein